METDADLVLDANAVGGLLREIFSAEVTAAAGRCAGCGAVGVMATAVAYVHGPGTVLRCPLCRGVLIRVAVVGGRYRLDLRGLRWLELDGP